jgi:large subunit ribosomal protein L9
MEIILKQDVEHLGHKDELVNVKNGFARNFLIPRKLAIEASEANKKMLTEMVKQRRHKEEKLKKEAEAIAAKLSKEVVKVGAKAGAEGKIFGSVTSLQLANALMALGYQVDRKSVSLKDDHVKNLGTYQANVKLHKEVTTTVNFEVVAE